VNASAAAKRTLLIALAALAAGCTALPATDGSEVTFALMGDTPYSEREVRLLDALIDDLNAQDLAFVVHVGDITGGRGPCTDAWFDARQRQFNRIRHPFVLVPGDNEWVDCHRSGPFDPLERLDRIRALFHSGDESLGQRRMKLERQSADPGGRFGEYHEHVRWIVDRVVFVGLNVQGSNNNLGRTPQMDEEERHRMAAVRAWLDESVALALSRGLDGMVVMVQADPDFGGTGRRTPDGFAEFRDMLRDAALRFRKPFLFVHGDTHVYRQDRPLADPSTGKTIANFVRLEVPGSPQVAWLKAGISHALPGLFSVSPAPLPFAP